MALLSGTIIGEISDAGFFSSNTRIELKIFGGLSGS